MFKIWTWYSPTTGSHKEADDAQDAYVGSQWRRPMVMARLSREDVEPYALGRETGEKLAAREPGDRVLFLRHMLEARGDIPDAHTGDLRLQAAFGWYRADQWFSQIMLPFWRGVRDVVDQIDGVECEQEKQRGPYTYANSELWADDAMPLLTDPQINRAMPGALRGVSRSTLVSSNALKLVYARWSMQHRADAIRKCVVQPVARLFGVTVPVGNYYDYEPDQPTAMGLGRPALYLDPAQYGINGFKALIAARNLAIAAGPKSTGWWSHREERNTTYLAQPTRANLELLGHIVSMGIPSVVGWAKGESDADRAAIDEWCDENVARLSPPKRIRGLKAAAITATELQTAGMVSRASDEVWQLAIPDNPL